MKTNYEQDGNGNLILPQSEWPTLSPRDLKLRNLLGAVYMAKDRLDYSTLAERSDATIQWQNASAAYAAELRSVALTH